MKKTNKVIITSVIVAVLLLGIGYAAIQNITLNIAGTAAADPSQANFKVMFTGTPTVSDDTYVTTAITDDTNATINVEGLTKKGDVVTVTYTVQNASEDLSADLAVSTTNNNTEFFTLSSEIPQTSLVAGEETTLVVTVELTKTPITDSVSTTVGVQLEAMPVQPGEEGTSEGINGSSQTPSGINEYGFYFDKFYANQDEGFGFIAHKDGSAEMFAYMLSGEIEGLESDEWMCMDYLSAGEFDFNEMITDEVTISNDGKIINVYGVDLEILDIDFHGLYYGCEYSIETDDNREAILVLKENGTVQLTTYENGEIIEDILEENFLTPTDNGFIMKYNNEIALISNVNGEVIFFGMVEGTFTLKEKHNYVSEVIKKVTCNEDGEIKYTCTDCSKTYTMTVLATNHSNDADNDGVCDECGETITYTDFEVESYNRNMVGYSNSTTELIIPSTFYNERSRTWYKVTKIDSYAFRNCTNLTSIVIPEGVTTLYRDMFSECTNLTKIVIPNSVTTIENTPFENCKSLTTIDVDSNNPNYCSVDGILYNKSMTTLIRYPEGKLEKVFTIPDGVSAIDSYAFSDCTNLTNIVIQAGVSAIGEHAFSSCSNLVNVNIPEGINTISRYMFYHCKKIESIEIPDSVTTIEEWAFSYCSNLNNIVIPNNVTTIGERAFSSCSNLANVSIPEGINTISDYMFYHCTKLESVNIPDSVTDIGEYAFYYCSNLTKINIPESVTTIGEDAFTYCLALTEIEVNSNNLNYCSIDGILYNKTATTLLKYPEGRVADIFTIPEGVKIIAYGAFENNTNLINVIIPESVTNIETYAFLRCSNLTSVIIPKGLTTINYGTFWDCSNLTNVVIPNSVTIIGESAFNWCYNLTTVNYTGTEEQWNSISIGSNNTYLTNATINYNYVVPTE